jgi:hypothetical protein
VPVRDDRTKPLLAWGVSKSSSLDRGSVSVFLTKQFNPFTKLTTKNLFLNIRSMVRLPKAQNSPKLRKGGGNGVGICGGMCSGATLICMCCFCLMMNVMVLGITLLINVRLKEKKGGAASPQDQGGGGEQQVQQPYLKGGGIAEANAIAGEAVRQSAAQDSPRYHIIFTTDCKDPNQDWQAYTFFYHVMKSGQHGDVTRIATGCSKPRSDDLLAVHKEQIEPMGRLTDGGGESRFHFYVAPAHPEQTKVGDLRKFFKYFNRPRGILEWMEKVMGYSPSMIDNNAPNQNMVPQNDNVIILLMEVDMVILRPFEDDLKNKQELYKKAVAGPNVDPQTKVTHGHPIAQYNVFPSFWWEGLVLTTVPNVPAMAEKGLHNLQSMPRTDVDNYFLAGSPIFITARDLYPIAHYWNEFTYPLYKALDEKIIREPYGPYALAAASLQRRHQLALSFRVQQFKESAFALFDQLFTKGNQAADNNAGEGGLAEASCHQVPDAFKPHVLQYSKRYALGNFIIGKHYVPDNYIGNRKACKQALMAEPPDNVAELYNYYMDPEVGDNHIEISNPAHLRQMTFMLCETLQAINQAAIHYKRKHCTEEMADGTVNLQKTILFT